MSQEKKIHQFLIDHDLTLALAESCSGGHLAARFTSLPDASKYFLGSIVTYSNRFKHEILKVENETLRVNGAVSRAAAHEMWLGLMKLTDADFGISVTGIAGPSGGTKEKPVGTVYVAVGKKEKKPHVVECFFEGNRQEVITLTCEKALEELALLLEIT